MSPETCMPYTTAYIFPAKIWNYKWHFPANFQTYELHVKVLLPRISSQVAHGDHWQNKRRLLPAYLHRGKGNTWAYTERIVYKRDFLNNAHHSKLHFLHPLSMFWCWHRSMWTRCVPVKYCRLCSRQITLSTHSYQWQESLTFKKPTLITPTRYAYMSVVIYKKILKAHVVWKHFCRKFGLKSCFLSLSLSLSHSHTHTRTHTHTHTHHIHSLIHTLDKICGAYQLWWLPQPTGATPT